MRQIGIKISLFILFTFLGDLLFLTLLPSTSFALKFDPEGTSAALGNGFNSFKGESRGECITYRDIGTLMGSSRGSGHSVNIGMKIVTSSAQLQQALGVSGSLSLSFGLFGGGAKAKYLKDVTVTNSTIFAVVKVTVVNQTETIRTPLLKPFALTLLKEKNFRFFYKKCGDSFVQSRQSGGEFIAVIKIELSDMSQKKKIEGELNASWLNFKAKVGASSKVEQSLKQMKIDVWMDRKGDNAPLPPGNIRSVFRYANIFPSRLKGGKAYPLYAFTKEYDIIDNFPEVDLPKLKPKKRYLKSMVKLLSVLDRTINSFNFILKNKRLYYNPRRYRTPLPQYYAQQKVYVTRYRRYIKKLAEDCIDNYMKQTSCQKKPSPFPFNILWPEPLRICRQGDKVYRTRFSRQIFCCSRNSNGYYTRRGNHVTCCPFGSTGHRQGLDYVICR